MFETIGNFFKQMGNWLSSLFSGEDEVSVPVIPEPTIPEQLDIEPIEPIVDPQTPSIPKQEPEDQGERETDQASTEDENADAENPDAIPTAVTDGVTDGIIEAYFAKKVLKKIGDEVSREITYNFRNPQDTQTEQQKRKIAREIIGIKETEWSSTNEFAYEAAIASMLVKDRYDAEDPVRFNLYKMQSAFERIDASPLESDIYVFAKTGNLDEKQMTITIHEKEELLVGADVPLPVLLRDGETEETQASEDLEEITELVATIEEGQVAIPIRLRPLSDDDLQEWKRKMAGELEDEHSDEDSETQESEMGGENEVSDPEPVVYIVKSGDSLSGISSNYPGVNWQDIQTANNLSNPSQIQVGQVLTIPINGEVGEDNAEAEELESQAVFLWLKATAQGKEEGYEEEFLNENEDTYFQIGGGCCHIDQEFFFEKYDEEFTGNLSDANKDSLKKMFLGIGEYYDDEKKCCNLKHIAYMLATAKHETAHTYDPISEYGGTSYFQQMYDPVLGKNERRRNLARANGNTTEGDGVKYRGRGFVQLTWKDNYQKMTDKFGIDFVNNPDKALEHELAIKIMIYGSEEGIFTGRSLSDYINETETDYYNARRVINGTDKAVTIQGYSEKIEKCLKIGSCNC